MRLQHGFNGLELGLFSPTLAGFLGVTPLLLFSFLRFESGNSAVLLIGSWVAIFPGTLEVLLGLEYDFEATWGVSQFTFEAFALGTLGCILALGLVGYARGKKVRDAVAPVHATAELIND